MSVPFRVSLQRFFFGELVYTEHEGLQAFQHRFLISVSLSAVVFMLALIAIYWKTSRHADFFPFVAMSWAVCALAYVGLWQWLRLHPRRLQLGSLLTAGIYWVNLCIPGYMLPPDPLLPMWTTLLIVGVFMMAGRTWGWVATALGIASSYLLLSRVDLTPFPNAILTLWAASLGSAVLGHIYVARFNYFFSRMAYYNERLQWLSTRDSLTGTLNAAAFYDQCNAQLALCRRQGLPYAVLFVDLDHFKFVNDNYGHAAGDRVLKQVADIVQGCMRKSDLLGRVGGEEFSVFLTGTTLEESQLIAESIRTYIEGQQMTFNGRAFQVTASIGLAWASRSDPALESIHDVQQLADKAMYEAKRSGRNQVALFTPETGQRGA